MSTLKPLKIDIVSDVVCPWCYIGKRRIENALALVPDVPVEVRWRPYRPVPLAQHPEFMKYYEAIAAQRQGRLQRLSVLISSRWKFAQPVGRARQ